MAFRRTEVKVMILHLKRDLKWCPAPHTLGHPIITPFEFIIRGSKLDLGACPGKYCALGMLAVPDCLTVCLFGGADGFQTTVTHGRRSHTNFTAVKNKTGSSKYNGVWVRGKIVKHLRDVTVWIIGNVRADRLLLFTAKRLLDCVVNLQGVIV